MSNNIAQKGINPLTGGTAFRDIVYNVLRTRPGQVFTPTQMTAVTGLSFRNVNPALGGLNTKNYPHVHRIGRGQYVYDPSRPERVWSGFSKMKRKQSRNDVERVAAIVSTTPRFVETFPVFERGSKGITMAPDAYVLKDDKGNLWQATKV